MNKELYNFRKEKELTQEEMAKLLKVKVGAYFKYEHNLNEMPYRVLINFLKLRNNAEDDIVIRNLIDFICR